jgi:hypothetical protein
MLTKLKNFIRRFMFRYKTYFIKIAAEYTGQYYLYKWNPRTGYAYSINRNTEQKAHLVMVDGDFYMHGFGDAGRYTLISREETKKTLKNAYQQYLDDLAEMELLR